MKLSQQTINLLKNFSDINENLLIEKGKFTVKTISEIENIFAIGMLQTDEAFPVDVPIYQLKEFLGFLSLVKDFSLDFTDSAVIIYNTDTQVRYQMASKSIITYPENDLVMPSVDFSIELTNAVISQIRSACSLLGEDTVVFSASSKDDSLVSVSVMSLEDVTANSFEIHLQLAEGTVPENERFILNVKNLKIIPQTYYTSFSKLGLMRMSSDNKDVEYYIALEEGVE